MKKNRPNFNSTIFAFLFLWSYPSNSISNAFVPSIPILKPSSILYNNVNSKELTYHTMEILKPMGIILEEDSEGSPGVVTIAKIDPNGNTAKTILQTLSTNNNTICIRDQILNVNTQSCANLSLEQVMDLIIESEDDGVTLTVGRNSTSTSIEFSNGICVSATPGESFGSLAKLAFIRIPYSCDSGGCGTCEQVLRGMKQSSDDKEEEDLEEWEDDRYIRPCIARVPKGYKRIALFPSDRFEPQL